MLTHSFGRSSQRVGSAHIWTAYPSTRFYVLMQASWAQQCMRSRATRFEPGPCYSTRSVVSREMSRKANLVPAQFDAVAFDLDGVVTDTARIHFRAWKQTFDASFEARSREGGV